MLAALKIETGSKPKMWTERLLVVLLTESRSSGPDFVKRRGNYIFSNNE